MVLRTGFANATARLNAGKADSERFGVGRLLEYRRGAIKRTAREGPTYSRRPPETAHCGGNAAAEFQYRARPLTRRDEWGMLTLRWMDLHNVENFLPKSIRVRRAASERFGAIALHDVAGSVGDSGAAPQNRRRFDDGGTWLPLCSGSQLCDYAPSSRRRHANAATARCSRAQTGRVFR